MSWTALGVGADNQFYYRNGDQWFSSPSEIRPGAGGAIEDSAIPSSATRGDHVAGMPSESWPEVAGWTRTVNATTHGATYSRDGVTRTFEAGQQGNVHSDLATHVPPPVAAPGSGSPGGLPSYAPPGSPPPTDALGSYLYSRGVGMDSTTFRSLVPREPGETDTAYDTRIRGYSETELRDRVAVGDANSWMTFYRDNDIPPADAYRDMKARGILADGAVPPERWPPRPQAVRLENLGRGVEDLPHTGAGASSHTTREPYDVAADQAALGPRTTPPATPPAGTMRALFASPAYAGAAHRADRISYIQNDAQRVEVTNGWISHATAPVSAGGLGWDRARAVGTLSSMEPPLMVNGAPNPAVTPQDMATRLYRRPEGTAYDPAHPTAGTPIDPAFSPVGGGPAQPVTETGPNIYDPAHPPDAITMAAIRYLGTRATATAAGIGRPPTGPGGAAGGPSGPRAAPPGTPADAASLIGGDSDAAAAYARGLAAWDAANPGGVGGPGGAGAGGPPPVVNPAVPGAAAVVPPGVAATGAPAGTGGVTGTPAPPAEMDRAVADLPRYGITDPADIAAFRSAYGNASTETLRAAVPPLGTGETPGPDRITAVRAGLVDGMNHMSGARLKARFGDGQMDDATADALAAQMYREGTPPVNPDSNPPPSLAAMWAGRSGVDSRIDALQPVSPATSLSRSDPAVQTLMANTVSYYRPAAADRIGGLFPAGTYYANNPAGRGHRSSDANLYLINNGVYDSPSGLRSIVRTPPPAAGGTDPLASGVTSFSTTLGTGTGTAASPLRRGLEERLGRANPQGVDTTGWNQQQLQAYTLERYRRGNAVEDRVAGENMTREGWAFQRAQSREANRHAMGMAYLNQYFAEKNQKSQFAQNLATQAFNQNLQLAHSQIQQINQLTQQQIQAISQITAALLQAGTPNPMQIVLGMLGGGGRR